MDQPDKHTAQNIPQALQQVQPKTAIEESILGHPDWLKGAIWGKPRWGHPEGAVIHHIVEVLKNVDRLLPHCGEENWYRLRLIAMLHDTFKYQVDPQQPRRGDNHHSRLASCFAEQYISDPATLAVIRHHDDPYHLWLGWHPNSKLENRMKAELQAFLDRMEPHCQLFYWFYWCDNNTGDKVCRALRLVRIHLRSAC